jgi:hypothetical protein
VEIIVEVILQFIFEILLQLLAEVFCELGLRPVTEMFKGRRVQNPWLASVGYLLVGAAVGGLSLLLFKSSMIHNSFLRIVNLVVTPILAGLVMVAIGHLREKRGQQLVRLDRFGYGFIFAFGMALVRFLYATKPVT